MKKTGSIQISSVCYVLRLYRQEQGDHENLPGIREEPIRGKRFSFKNFSESQQILESIEQVGK